jgi:hypothetical protein
MLASMLNFTQIDDNLKTGYIKVITEDSFQTILITTTTYKLHKQYVLQELLKMPNLGGLVQVSIN